MAYGGQKAPSFEKKGKGKPKGKSKKGLPKGKAPDEAGGGKKLPPWLKGKG